MRSVVEQNIFRHDLEKFYNNNNKVSSLPDVL